MARRCSTICLPFHQALYPQLVADPTAFRQALAGFFRQMPELFPEGFDQGFLLKDLRPSRKLGLCLRRVRLKATGWPSPARPAFALPYMAGLTADVSGPLFLRAFAVPFRALARVFGRDHGHWYRLEVAPGRNSVAGAPCARRARLSTCWR